MSDSFLFFGFLLSENDEKILASIDPILLKLFIQQEDTDYLQIFLDERNKYLGKKINNSVNLLNLELVQTHIQSILKKLSCEFSTSPPVLFPFTQF